MTEKTNFTTGELLDYVPTKSDNNAEFRYRAGYYAAIDDVVRELPVNVTRKRLEQFLNGDLYRWAYRTSCEDIVMPPALPNLKR